MEEGARFCSLSEEGVLDFCIFQIQGPNNFATLGVGPILDDL